MSTTTADLSRRDRAILAAVGEGRCSLAPGSALLVDGRCCADQFAVARLRSQGWIRVALPPGGTRRVQVAELTDEARLVLAA